MHTPLPWKLEANGPGFNLTSPDRASHFCILIGMEGQPEGEHEANGHHIVHCVNTHPAILAVLEAVLLGAPPTEPEYQDWGGDTERAENYGAAQEHWRLAQIARAAIAAAEPKEG